MQTPSAASEAAAKKAAAGKTAAQAEIFSNRLKKRLSHLRKWAKRSGAGAFRLYDRDIPEIPLVLDLYGDIAVGALYKRPYEKDPAEEANWLHVMREAAARSIGLDRNHVIIKQRERQRGQAQYEKITGRKLIREITEGTFKFKVNLSDYLDTGLFLDRRLLRRMVCEDSQGKRVLNLFCYTGSFSVAAAAGGAISVDLPNEFFVAGFLRQNLRSGCHKLSFYAVYCLLSTNTSIIVLALNIITRI